MTTFGSHKMTKSEAEAFRLACGRIYERHGPYLWPAKVWLRKFRTAASIEQTKRAIVAVNKQTERL